MLDKNKKILIVGLGLIGGSYADGLTSAGYEVGAIARRKETLDYALGKGIIKSGRTEADEEYLARFDIIVFCLYPKVFIKWLEKYGRFLKKGAVATDVTGVKGQIVGKAESILSAHGVNFVGAHPMAGKEVYGVENADKRIFSGANYIITPTENSDKNAVEVCRELGETLGFKRIAELSPERHDEMIGFTSQLTHCIAVSLMNCKDDKKLVEYTGNSFRDLTRIANINEDMWCELFLLNDKELLAQMEVFAQKFSDLKKAIENKDEEKIKEMMKISTVRRKYFDK